MQVSVMYGNARFLQSPVQTALSISADSSGITTIPLVTLDAIWAKAIELYLPAMLSLLHLVAKRNLIHRWLLTWYRLNLMVSTYVITAVSNGFPVNCAPTL